MMADLFDDGASVPATITADELLTLWNDAATAHDLRGARELTDGRRRRVVKLLKAHPTRAYWQDVIARITQSGFCTGRIPGRDRRTWKADFDFFTRLETHVKVLEGKYDDDASDTRARGRAHIYSDAPSLDMKRFAGGH